MTSWGLASCSDEIDSVWRNCYLLRSWRGPSDVSALVCLMGKSNISPPALFRRTCSWKPTWKWPTVLLFVLGGMKPQWQWTETLVKFKILIWDVCTQPQRIIIDHLKFTRKKQKWCQYHFWILLRYPQKKTSKNNDKPQDSGVSIPDGGLQMGKSEWMGVPLNHVRLPKGGHWFYGRNTSLVTNMFCARGIPW